ncbi:hypothetical protein FQR65_LT10125 [Abscondita terminalis]|nr:hypothetical protein FQR65_LT10125 [Abscondita terminalis]
MIVNAIGEQCQTPLGQNGTCVRLADCQQLLWSFANPKTGMIEYLNKFECGTDRRYGVFVCCHMATNMLVFEDSEDTYNPDSIHNVKKLTNDDSCGRVSNKKRDNKLTHLQEFPWVVKIIFTSRGHPYERLGCNGVILNSRHVLYSGQCHYAEWDPLFFVQIEYYIGGGSNCDDPSASYTKNCSRSNHYEIELLTIHPFYDRVTHINDIAILRTIRRIEFSEMVSPICLPLIEETFIPDRVLYTVGWNYTYLLTDNTVKTVNASTSITNSHCKNLNKSGNFLTSFDMCTINATGRDDHEIGNPVMYLHKNKWYLVGFSSRGKEPRIITRVQNYLQWIKEVIGGERCLTPTNEIGECVQVNDCPKFLVAFANVHPNDEEYLKTFICGYSPTDKNRNILPVSTLTVCCSYNSSFTISTTSLDVEPDIYNLSDKRYCGYQHRDDYLSYDERLSVDEFPWLAAVVNGTVSLENDTICGGVLITNRYVLTSAQCVFTIKPEDDMLVRLGDYNLKSDKDCFQAPGLTDVDCADKQEHKVIERRPHPFYNRWQLLNDVALLKLEKVVTFSDYVRPICFPTSENDDIGFGGTMYMTGFGGLSWEVKGPRIKKKIFTTLISNEVCAQKAEQYHYQNRPTDYQICTDLYKNSTDITCLGDEGGPVMYKKKNQWYLHGISSSFGCVTGEPLFHLKIFKYLKWIRLNIKK